MMAGSDAICGGGIPDARAGGVKCCIDDQTFDFPSPPLQLPILPSTIKQSVRAGFCLGGTAPGAGLVDR